MAGTCWTQFEEGLVEKFRDWKSDPKNARGALLDQLQSLTKFVADDASGSSVTLPILNVMLQLVTERRCPMLAAECFRVMRNCAALNKWDSHFRQQTVAIEAAIQLVADTLPPDGTVSEGDLVLCRIALQFVGNTVNSRPAVSDSVWRTIQNVCGDLLVYEDEKVACFAASIVNSLLNHSSCVRDEVLSNKDLVTNIITLAHKGIDFCQYSIQLLLNDPTFLQRIYAIQGLNARLFLLHQISEFLPSCHADNICFLSPIFQARADVILRTCDSAAMDLEALEIVAIAEVLAKASCQDSHKHKLTLDENLLSSTIELLRSIHALGQSGSNYFTVVGDHFDSVEHHPALNFRCNLVRIIGNLCHRSVAVQNRVRELEALPLLLECCNLDARNPLIQQWSVLAIRNLCEENRANQQFIASLKRQGVVQPAALDNIGLVVEESSSGLSVRPASSMSEQ